MMSRRLRKCRAKEHVPTEDGDDMRNSAPTIRKCRRAAKRKPAAEAETNGGELPVDQSSAEVPKKRRKRRARKSWTEEELEELEDALLKELGITSCDDNDAKSDSEPKLVIVSGDDDDAGSDSEPKLVIVSGDDDDAGSDSEPKLVIVSGDDDDARSVPKKPKKRRARKSSTEKELEVPKKPKKRRARKSSTEKELVEPEDAPLKELAKTSCDDNDTKSVPKERKKRRARKSSTEKELEELEDALLKELGTTSCDDNDTKSEPEDAPLKELAKTSCDDNDTKSVPKKGKKRRARKSSTKKELEVPKKPKRRRARKSSTEKELVEIEDALLKELGTISGDDGDAKPKPEPELVTISDDDDDAKPKEENDVRFPNGLSITVDDFRNYLRPNSMMCGPLASAMFNHFLPVHKGLRDKGFNFCDPEVFANILSVYKKFPEHELTEEMVARFVNRKGEAREYLKDLLICRFSMIPVCFMDHWILAILQMKYTKECKDIRARLIVVDSLLNSTSHKHRTEIRAVTTYRAIGLALKAALQLGNSRYALGKYTLVRVEKMPCQTNGYDGGFYMTLFAETLATYSSWREWPDANLAKLKLLPKEEIAFRKRVRTIRAEIAAYAESLAGRKLELVMEMETNNSSADESWSAKENIDPEQVLVTITDDDGDAKPKEENKVRFPNGLSITVHDLRNYLRPRSLMCGALASAMFNHFLPDYKGLRSTGFNLCDPEVFALILSVYKKFPEHELTKEMVAGFANRKGQARDNLKDLLMYRFSMIPVCLSGHWVLAILQLRHNLELKHIRARLIVIDSLFNSTSHTDLTQFVAFTAYHAIGLALKATLQLGNSLYTLGNYTLVRMERMPCQTNQYDCGFYMTLFAEDFARHDGWKRLADAHLPRLGLDRDLEIAFRKRVEVFRAEIAAYAESVAGRKLRLIR